MNFKNFENKFKRKAETANLLQASWSQVRFIPDLITNEQLAIGVLINHDGIVHTKFIEDFGRVECAYGSEIANYTKNCIELFEDFLHQNFDDSFSSQLVLDKRGLVQGNSIDSLLSELLERAVPLSLPHNQAKNKKQFHTVKTVKFHSDVKTYVKNKMGDLYKEIFAEEKGGLLVGDDSIGFKTLPIAINIKKNHKIGDLISSVYATPEKVEINCLKTLSNLQSAKKYTDLNSDFRLFMLLPDQDNLDLMTQADKKKHKEIISDFKWSLGSVGIDLIESSSIDSVSEKIIDWSGIDKDRIFEETI
ncbi:hypothetical protein F975_01674 [Acinetobacter sp. ANC 3789]|uniref:hypothetical protein n=1 Tax=Acinetobacter sp. ANC 3789 TaxID=1217714 RepID=UPI0002D03310|nr:hypothetical protein [Acinetobacter sp. ANC 3789]ENU80620.1 hypothetical protein F975_01674 [Acinetobacter sp. ANC 3789]